jgi:ATP-dependent Lon protease
VILPTRNRRDLEDIPESARAMLEFVWVDHVAQALEVAFGGAPSVVEEPPKPRARATSAYAKGK